MLSRSKPAVKETKGSKPFHCPQCKVTSSTVADLRKHIKSSHSKTETKNKVIKKSKRILDEDLSLLNDTENSITILDEQSEELVKKTEVINVSDVHIDEKNYPQNLAIE